MITINGVEWQIFFVASNHPILKRWDGSFSVGCCDNNTQSIFLSMELSGYLLKKVLCHELVHAAMFSYKVFLDVETEELFADLVATYGEEIVDVTNYLFDNLIKKEGF